MGGDRLNRDLERLHGVEHKNEQSKDALEKDLLLRYRNRHPKNKRWLSMLNPQAKVARFAVVGLAMLLLGVAACSTQTTTEVEVGKQVSIGLESDSLAKSGDLQIQIDGLVQVLGSFPGVEDINVNIEETVDGEVTLDIMLFGEGLDAEALTAMVHNDFPELADAEIVIENLEGTITESWARHLGRQVFDFEIEGGTEEEIRAQILQQLADDGFEGEAEVHVVNEGDTQKIEIIMTEDIED